MKLITIKVILYWKWYYDAPYKLTYKLYHEIFYPDILYQTIVYYEANYDNDNI